VVEDLEDNEIIFEDIVMEENNELKHKKQKKKCTYNNN
jgi:hypothetical protein